MFKKKREIATGRLLSIAPAVVSAGCSVSVGSAVKFPEKQIFINEIGENAKAELVAQPQNGEIYRT